MKTALKRAATSCRRLSWIQVFGSLLLSLHTGAVQSCAAQAESTLPAGVAAIWDLSKAYRETTATRERVCLNGLWQWQPATPQSNVAPNGEWGYFKVPGSWPEITDYMQKDSQTVHSHPSWKDTNLARITAAWYQRDLAVPEIWSGRRFALHIQSLNSFAAVFVDGAKVGEIHFPGGELDLTAACRPGESHRLDLLVLALPLKGVLLSYTDSASAREVKGAVARRGICGDVYLVSTPPGPRIGDVRIEPSIRQHQLGVDAAVEQLPPDAVCTLRARVRSGGKILREFASSPFRQSELRRGRMKFFTPWEPDQLWDLHTPANQLELELALLDAKAGMLDETWVTRFGFREFWIEGRDFILNGVPLHLSAVPLDNAQISAASATYTAARESLLRLQGIGINYVYTHNYGCEPGSHLGFEEILRAADDVGMLVGFSQPHFSHYDWQTAAADQTNGYARHAAYYVQAAQNHPSVVMYPMSHNATGYNEDMNPDMIDGLQADRDSWASKNVQLALRAEAIVKQLDPSRIVYHHASGNLGAMHNSNFYPNFVPIQELSDWFGHWAKHGVKPAFTCEYGAPFSWDWTLYRGWYQGRREFGSAKVPWEFCLAEWNAQFLGDRAYQISDLEKANLRWEAKQYRAGNTWHRWDYPHAVGSDRFDERYPVFARYLTDNWRAFRTWGVSGISPWDHGHYWKLRPTLQKQRRELPVDWANLQRPGFSPDYTGQHYERIDLAFERSDWLPTPAAHALLRNNQPLLAYIGGKPAAFTSKDHNFFPGESFEKQAIVINNSREPVTAELRWWFEPSMSKAATRQVTIPPGGQNRMPLQLKMPLGSNEAPQTLRFEARFSNRTTQADQFTIHPVRPLRPHPAAQRIAVFDPRGETQAWLKSAGRVGHLVQADSSLEAFDLLIIGKAALTPDGPAPDIRRVRDGLKVLVFEQTPQALEQRLGFRIQEYGLRQVFARIPDHPALRDLSSDHFQDWRGESTIIPPSLKYELRPRTGPTVQWSGIPVPHLWRCGNRGNVASVLIEKPARGDFLPVLDGGFSLQYATLLEFREGKGVVLFCQTDVTGRTEPDPAASVLAGNLLEYMMTWKPRPRRRLVYAGDPAGKNHLESVGITLASAEATSLSSDDLLVLSPGGGQTLATQAEPIQNWIRGGGLVLAIGFEQDDANALPQPSVGIRTTEHIATYFEPPGIHSVFAGICPADAHNRDPKDWPLVTSGAQILGDGILARVERPNLVLCSLIPWRLGDIAQPNIRRTHRRVTFLLSRLLANLGAAATTPLLARFHQPVQNSDPGPRILQGLYSDVPTEWDDPYRFFRW